MVAFVYFEDFACVPQTRRRVLSPGSVELVLLALVLAAVSAVAIAAMLRMLDPMLVPGLPGISLGAIPRLVRIG